MRIKNPQLECKGLKILRNGGLKIHSLKQRIEIPSQREILRS